MNLMNEIATRMAAMFQVSRAEAVARINCHWRGHSFKEGATDIVFHGIPDYWADRIFYQDVFEDGRLSRIPRPAPDIDSDCWTI